MGFTPKGISLNSFLLESNLMEKVRKNTMLVYLNPLYSGGPFHCYMLDESICHCRCIGSMLLLF